MPHDAYYDGSRVIIHTVKPGETLSRIAAYYKFKSYHPIWIYNTQIQNMLDVAKGPDRLAAGERLFVPRSEEGYKALLKKLEVLRIQMDGAVDEELERLEGLANGYKAQETAWDFAGDVVTTIASLGAKAGEVARLRKEAEALSGSARYAKEIQLKKALEDMADAVSPKELGKAMISGGAQKMADDSADTKGQSKFTSTLPKAATFATKTLPKSATLIKDFQKDWKLGSTLKRTIGLSHLTVLLDIADIALDYIKVSTAANLYIRWRSGENVEQSFQSAKDGVERSRAQALTALHAKVLRIQKEFEAVYGKGPASPADEKNGHARVLP